MKHTKNIVSLLLVFTLLTAGIQFHGISMSVSQSVFAPAAVVQAATLGQKNALAKAKSYLAYTAFSKKGLVKQLKFEGFTAKEANYGVAHCGANWKKQAAKKAKSYLDMTSFSKSGLMKQLKFEGFTTAQVKYAVKKVGY
jgi:hypothetical protein